MKSEHRSLVAIGLSVAVMMAWYVFLGPKTPPAATPEAPAAAAAPQAAATPAPTTPVATETVGGDPQANLPAVESVLTNSAVRAVFTSKGGVPTEWLLANYRESTDKGSPPLNLVAREASALPTIDFSFENANFSFPTLPTYRLIRADAKSVLYEWQSGELKITKKISFGDGAYTADVEVRVENVGPRALTAQPTLTVSGTSLPAQKSGFFSFLKQAPATNKSPVYFLDGNVHRSQNVGKIPAMQMVAADAQKGSGLYWAGLEDRYFLSAVIPRAVSSGVAAVMGAAALPSAGKDAYEMFAGAGLAPMNVPPGGVSDMKFSVYMGPKDIDALKAMNVSLDKAIDYGWFTVIAMPILYLLKIFYKVVMNYGIAIILLTIFIKLLLHPINVRSMKSMKAMQQLQPKLKELQKKYANDREKLNLETMQLFKTHKVNPMGGCLPMVAQFPIYIALYKVLWSSIELYHAPFFWFYRDLSAPDPYLITPILLGLFMVAQQKLTPSASADPAQQKMMMIMPVMFTGFMLFLPVGLVVYILVNTAMSVTQQHLYNKGIRMRDVLRGKFAPSS